MTNQLVSFLPPESEFKMMKELATIAVESGMISSAIKTPKAALMIMLKGRELNLQPMVAFSHIHIINGKPCMSAELMLTLIYRNNPNALIRFIKNDNQACTLEASRSQSNPSTWSFTIEDADQAGLLGKGPWKQFPAAMLRARCISSMARAMFPDVLNGVSYTPEEIGADVQVDEDGSETIVEKDVTPAAPVSPKAEEKKEVKQAVVETPAKPPRPSDVIYGHLKEAMASVDEMKSILVHFFAVESFKSLTDEHLEKFKSLTKEMNLLDAWKIEIVSENKNETQPEQSVVENEVVDSEGGGLDWSPESTPALPDAVKEKVVEPTPEPITEKSEEKKSQSPYIPQKQKMRNYGLANYKIPNIALSLAKFKTVEFIPVDEAKSFIAKSGTWEQTKELHDFVEALKGFWGLK